MTISGIHAVAELAASQHSVFTRRQAAALSFTAHRMATALAQGWLVEPYPGVLCIGGAPPTYERALMSATMAAGGHGLHHTDRRHASTGSTVSRSHRRSN